MPRRRRHPRLHHRGRRDLGGAARSHRSAVGRPVRAAGTSADLARPAGARRAGRRARPGHRQCCGDPRARRRAHGDLHPFARRWASAVPRHRLPTRRGWHRSGGGGRRVRLGPAHRAPDRAEHGRPRGVGCRSRVRAGRGWAALLRRDAGRRLRRHHRAARLRRPRPLRPRRADRRRARRLRGRALPTLHGSDGRRLRAGKPRDVPRAGAGPRTDRHLR